MSSFNSWDGREYFIKCAPLDFASNIPGRDQGGLVSVERKSDDFMSTYDGLLPLTGSSESALSGASFGLSEAPHRFNSSAMGERLESVVPLNTRKCVPANTSFRTIANPTIDRPPPANGTVLS